MKIKNINVFNTKVGEIYFIDENELCKMVKTGENYLKAPIEI